MNGVKPITCVACGLIRLLPGMKVPLMYTCVPMCAPSNSTKILRLAYDESSVKCLRYQRMLPVSCPWPPPEGRFRKVSLSLGDCGTPTELHRSVVLADESSYDGFITLAGSLSFR